MAHEPVQQSSDAASHGFTVFPSRAVTVPLGSRKLRVDESQRSLREFQFHFNQDEPSRLCRDRRLRTREIHKPNDFYGQASILKRYAGLPQAYAIKAVIEHGPAIHNTMWDQDRNALLPWILTCQTNRVSTIERLSGRRTIAIGFAGLYAMRLVEQLFAPIPESSRHGTIVFPCHSTHLCKAEFDHSDYASRLYALPEEMKPIVVCMYWRDYLDGAHIEYEKQGFRIVTAGHMYDPDFLLRFCDICRQFRYAVSNDLSTHLFQSVAAGCRFFYVHSGPVHWNWQTKELEDFGNQFLDEKCREVISRSFHLFGEPVPEATPQQMEYVNSVIGTDRIMSPKDLRHLLLKAEVYDKISPFHFVSDQEARKTIPAFWCRLLSPIPRLGRSIKKRWGRLRDWTERGRK